MTYCAKIMHRFYEHYRLFNEIILFFSQFQFQWNPPIIKDAAVFNEVKTLSEHGIPVNVMLAPIIPAINSHEILPLSQAASEHGVLAIAHTIVRLNGAIGEIFSDWIHKTMPDRADKVLHQIENFHSGSFNDSRYGTRMHGEGKIAEQINTLARLAKHKYFKGKSMPKLNCELHEPFKNGQWRLF